VNEPSFDVVHPVSRRPVVARTSNAGLSGVAGQKIALVWDYLFRGDEVFRLFKERFQGERPGVDFVDHEVFGDIHSHEELLDQLPGRLEEMGVDGTIVATGA
jgi:hypothetical protein